MPEFFWQQDQARQLESYLPALGDVTFYEGAWLNPR
jgi:glycyl-tRNA synthetase beta subunit